MILSRIIAILDFTASTDGGKGTNIRILNRGTQMDVDRRKDHCHLTRRYRNRVFLLMFQLVTIGIQDISRHTSIQPDIRSLNSHLHTMFEPNINGICEEKFIIKADVTLHLLFDGK